MLRNLMCTCPVESQQPNGSAAKPFMLHNWLFTLGKDQEENDATFLSAPSTSVFDFFFKHRQTAGG